MVGSLGGVKQGDLSGGVSRAGVRGFVVVMKRGNARGAKEARKVDV